MFQNGGQASPRLAAIQFELLPQIAEIAELAEIASSLAMSNIWPERGASCLKRLQTRLSGPDLYYPVCKLNKLIESTVFLRNKKKNRRKLPFKVPVETETFVAVPYSVDSACQTEACETESTLSILFLINTLLLWSNPFLMKVMLIGILGVSQEDSECADISHFFISFFTILNMCNIQGHFFDPFC